MRAVIVHHQMHIQRRRNIGFDRAQKLQKFAAAVASMQLADDFAGRDVQGRKQRGRTMTHVVMRTPLGDTRAQRQHGLRTVQRLDLTLLINA